MPKGYRVEASPNNRAMCRNTECKHNAVKITKGELRFATLVEIMEHQSWHWKHWGCVTPQVIGNIKEFIDGDVNMLDGYEELPADYQAKVRDALEQGHVDDEDWKGDPELNRPGQKGFKKRTPKKKAAEDQSDEEVAKSPTPAAKKRSRAPKDEANDDAPAPKKTKRKTKKDIASDGEEEPAPKKSKKPKKESTVSDEPAVKPAKKSKKTVKVERDEDVREETAPKPTKKSKKAAAPSDLKDHASAPPKKAISKVKQEADGDTEAKPKKARVSKKKDAEAQDPKEAISPPKAAKAAKADEVPKSKRGGRKPKPSTDKSAAPTKSKKRTA